MAAKLGCWVLPGPEFQYAMATGARTGKFLHTVFGMTSTVVPVKQRQGASIPTCSNPRADATVVTSSIYWSPLTCAHVIQGDVLQSWLRTGGPTGKLGYPVSDELPIPDHRGRMNLFEHGQI